MKLIQYPSMVDVVIEDERWEALGIEGCATRAVQATLAHRGLDPLGWDLTLLATDDARITALNASFREKDRATNVLSWPSAERSAEVAGAEPAPPLPDMFGDTHLGDIALSFETCTREAVDLGRAFGDHVTHLVVHGVLHLLGFDHERDSDAHLMEGIEVEILGKLGVSDPYGEG